MDDRERPERLDDRRLVRRRLPSSLISVRKLRFLVGPLRIGEKSGNSKGELATGSGESIYSLGVSMGVRASSNGEAVASDVSDATWSLYSGSFAMSSTVDWRRGYRPWLT
jgi:hypothetical protein